MGFDRIAAIVLAAGASRRMGQPKLLLPWGKTTILGHVVATFATAGLGRIVVVTGGDQQLVEGLLAKLPGNLPVRTVYNPDHQTGGMISSLQAGLSSLERHFQAALVALGDQPFMEQATIHALCSAFLEDGAPLVIPSVHGRGGHPWLVARPLWDEILALPTSATPRDFLHAHADQTRYILSDDSILQDLDTPEDYDRLRPRS